MSACHCCERPPDPTVHLVEDGALIFSEVGDLSDPGSPPALAGIGLDKTLIDFGGTAPYSGQSNVAAAWNGKFDSSADWGGDDQWSKAYGQVQVFFHPTATCYFKLWCDLVTYEIDYAASESTDAPVAGAQISTSAIEREWTPPSVDGFCVPTGFEAVAEADFAVNGDLGLVDPTLLTKWPSLAVIELPLPAVDEMTVLENIRWSCVPGYTPPSDGSANGFPA